jgi:DNA-binding CsgD family transcriptional regulator
MERLASIKRRARRLRDVQRAQEVAIAEAVAEGSSLRAVAAAAGMTPEGVRQLLKRTETK